MQKNAQGKREEMRFDAVHHTNAVRVFGSGDMGFSPAS